MIYAHTRTGVGEPTVLGTSSRRAAAIFPRARVVHTYALYTHTRSQAESRTRRAARTHPETGADGATSPRNQHTSPGSVAPLLDDALCSAMILCTYIHCSPHHSRTHTHAHLAEQRHRGVLSLSLSRSVVSSLHTLTRDRRATAGHIIGLAGARIAAAAVAPAPPPRSSPPTRSLRACSLRVVSRDGGCFFAVAPGRAGFFPCFLVGVGFFWREGEEGYGWGTGVTGEAIITFVVSEGFFGALVLESSRFSPCGTMYYLTNCIIQLNIWCGINVFYTRYIFWLNFFVNYRSLHTEYHMVSKARSQDFGLLGFPRTNFI